MQKAEPPAYGMAPPPSYPSYPAQPQVVVANFGPSPQTCLCPSCHSQIATRVEKESTTKTHLFALVLCLVFCPLVCIPYCTDSCLAVNHYCPSCGAYLGSYDK